MSSLSVATPIGGTLNLNTQDEKSREVQAIAKMASFVNLTDLITLTSYMAKNFQSQVYVNAALDIAKKIAEAAKDEFASELGKASFQRYVDDPNYGKIACCYPEMLAFAMQHAKEEIVLEIGGASGENALLLAFSEAKKVYLNDILSKEVELFEAQRKALPLEVSEKLESIPGDLFNILNVKPELEGQVGLIFCRNVIHFFNDAEEEKFISLLKKILKPGGMVVLTTNSVDTMHTLVDESILETEPLNTRFVSGWCLLTDGQYKPKVQLMQKFYRFSKEQFPVEKFLQVDLYTKNKETNGKWVADNNALTMLPKEVKKDILSKMKVFVGKMPKADVDYKIIAKINITRQFSPESLTNLFKDKSFATQFTFGIDGKGRLMDGSKKVGLASIVVKVGIVFTKLADSSAL